MKRKNQVSFLAVIGCILVSLLYMVDTQAATKEISINNDASRTSKRDVVLFLEAPKGATEMKVSNDISFPNTNWKPYQKTKTWELPLGRGQKVVYVQYRWPNGNTSSIFNDGIELSVAQGIGGKVQINTNVATTTSRHVILSIEYSPSVEEMFISNTNDFALFDSRPPAGQVPWTLTPGTGKKTVYVQMMNANGDYETFTDSISYVEAPGQLQGGTILQSSDSQVYYLGFDGLIHPFLHSAVFHSWFDSIEKAKIKTVSSLMLRQYQVGKSVCIRGGTWLVRFQNFPQLYAVETGCRLFPLRSEVEAQIIYGTDWKKRLVVLNEFESGSYTTLDRGIADRDNDVIDTDADGLDKDTESLYGSSDRLPDSDADGLSDLEEVVVWFTNPVDGDTDDDGTNDLHQVLTEYLDASIISLADDVYGYPGGLVIQSTADKRYYMRHIDAYTYALSKNIQDSAFTSNNFDTTFVISSSPYLSLIARAGWRVDANSDLLKYPSLITRQEQLYAL